MKKVPVLIAFLMFIPMGARGEGPFGLNVGFKVPVGSTLLFSSEEFSYYTDWDFLAYGEAGFGGYFEVIMAKVIGFEMDFVYERQGIWATEDISSWDVFRLPVLLKLKAGGTYISFGPHFLFGDVERVDLGGAIGYEVSISGMKVNIELPVVTINTWDEDGTFVDLQIRLGFGVGIF